LPRQDKGPPRQRYARTKIEFIIIIIIIIIIITFYCIREKSMQNLTGNTNTRNTDTTGPGKSS